MGRRKDRERAKSGRVYRGGSLMASIPTKEEVLSMAKPIRRRGRKTSGGIMIVVPSSLIPT